MLLMLRTNNKWPQFVYHATQTKAKAKWSEAKRCKECGARMKCGAIDLFSNSFGCVWHIHSPINMLTSMIFIFMNPNSDWIVKHTNREWEHIESVVIKCPVHGLHVYLPCWSSQSKCLIWMEKNEKRDWREISFCIDGMVAHIPCICSFFAKGCVPETSACMLQFNDTHTHTSYTQCRFLNNIISIHTATQLCLDSIEN